MPRRRSRWDKLWNLDTFFWGWRPSPNGQLVILDETELTVVNPDDSIAARFPLILDTRYDPQLVVQPDGRILIFNEDFTTINGVSVPHPGFARLNPDGSVDMTFRPAVDFQGQGDIYPIPLSDGRILVYPVVLVPNGSLDNTFHLDPLIPDPEAVVEDAQGKLIFAAAFPPLRDGAVQSVFRSNRDGSLDTTFTSVQVDGDVLHLLSQPDGKILVETATDGPGDGLHLTRLNQDGSIDPAFKATVPGPADYLSVLLLDGSKVLVMGPGPAIYRLNADGSLVKAFPVRLVLHSPDSGPTIRAMTLQSGRLRIVGEFVEVNGSPRFGAARLLLDEAPSTAAVIAPDPSYGFTAYWNYRNSGFEGMGDAQITVRRLGDTRGSATVNYRTQDGSAIAGKDYKAVSGTLSFAPFAVEKSFNLPILDTGIFEPDKALQLVLSPGSGVAAFAPPATFVIHKDEVRIQGLKFDGSSWALQFNSDPGSHYILESSPDLVRWELVDSLIAYDEISFLSDYGQPLLNQRFFRIKRGF